MLNIKKILREKNLKLIFDTFYLLIIGLSGLTTTSVQGSIVHGIPAQPPPTPLDLSPLRHHRSPATTPVSYSPSNSPALDMIQEEHPVEISRVCNTLLNMQSDSF